MSKLYGNYSDIEPYRDGGRNSSYAVTGYADHVRRPGMVEPEGRENPNTRYHPGYSSEGYVKKTERIVEHIITHAPVIGIVRPDPYCSFGDDHGPEMENYGVQERYPQPNYGHSQENFLTKIQTEVSRPQPVTKIPGPFTTNWRGRVSTGQEHQPNNHSTARSDADDHKGKNGHPMQKKIQTVPIAKIQPRFGVPPAQPKKEVISYSSGPHSNTIDSGEAKKRYGNLKPQPVPEKDEGAINSDDLIKKYNGAKVPW